MTLSLFRLITEYNKIYNKWCPNNMVVNHCELEDYEQFEDWECGNCRGGRFNYSPLEICCENCGVISNYCNHCESSVIWRDYCNFCE